MLNPSLHSISNSIVQILFKRGDIKDIFNQTDLTTNVPEGDVIGNLRCGKISLDSSELSALKTKEYSFYSCFPTSHTPYVLPFDINLSYFRLHLK